MLQILHLKSSHYTAEKWKNGRGVTHTIAAHPATPYHWRLSLAQVRESGPFSVFPGYDRSLTLLSGGPVQLSGSGLNKTIARLQPYPFKGDLPVTATVTNPAEDFNVFTLRSRANTCVYLVTLTSAETQFPLAGSEHFLFCPEGNVEVHDPASLKSFRLASRDTLWASRQTGEYLNLRACGLGSTAANCLWVVVKPSPRR